MTPLTALPSEITAMRCAILEAQRYIGATSPNPPVGAAALDRDSNLLAVAAHQRTGEDHAEAALIKLCQKQGLSNRLHTLCVTLEPCNHHGRTPPCSEAIIAAGFKRVIIGARDPDLHVKGGGIECLRAAGVEVVTDILEDECGQLIQTFAYQRQNGKPWVTVKRAFDRHGSMSPPPGQKTFTSQDSLLLAHRLRKKADAIVTGSGTILADRPLFTVRHVSDYPGKRRILAIVDRRGRVPENYIHEATTRGLEPIIYRNLQGAIDDLAARNLLDVLVEAGPTLSQAMLDAGLWNMSVTIAQNQFATNNRHARAGGHPVLWTQNKRETRLHGGDALEETIICDFNSALSLSFAPKSFSLENILPYE